MKKLLPSRSKGSRSSSWDEVVGGKAEYHGPNDLQGIEAAERWAELIVDGVGSSTVVSGTGAYGFKVLAEGIEPNIEYVFSMSGLSYMLQCVLFPTCPFLL